MKTYTDLINEADSAKLTADYNRYLLEKQYFISRKTANILLEQEDNDDDEYSIPFNRPFRGNQIYVHIDDDGRRLIRVVGSKEEAKALANNFKSTMVYDNGGNILDLTERVEDGADEKEYPTSPTDPNEVGTWETLQREKLRGAARILADNPKLTSSIEFADQLARDLGAFGPSGGKRKTMAERDKEVQELIDKLDAYDVEMHGKGYKDVKDMPLNDQETALIKSVLSAREQGSPALPGELESIGKMPKAQLADFRDYRNTVLKYAQGTKLRDFYESNPERFEKHERFMPTNMATAVMPLSVNAKRGSAVPKGLDDTVVRSAANLIASTPEILAMTAAATAAPTVVAGAVSRVPAVAVRVSPQAAARATDLAIRGSLAVPGAERLATGDDIVKKLEGLLMVAPAVAPVVTPEIKPAVTKAVDVLPQPVRGQVIGAGRAIQKGIETGKEAVEAMKQKPKETAAAGLLAATTTFAEPSMPLRTPKSPEVAVQTTVAPKPIERTGASGVSTKAPSKSTAQPTSVSREITTKQDISTSNKNTLAPSSAPTTKGISYTDLQNKLGVVGSASQAPAVQASATQAPATQAPATQAPAIQAPAIQAPAIQAPAIQAPAIQAPSLIAATILQQMFSGPSTPAAPPAQGPPLPGREKPQDKPTTEPDKAGGIPALDSNTGKQKPKEADADYSDGLQNWDLMLKNIYGKYAGTLTK